MNDIMNDILKIFSQYDKNDSTKIIEDLLFSKKKVKKIAVYAVYNQPGITNKTKKTKDNPYHFVILFKCDNDNENQKYFMEHINKIINLKVTSYPLLPDKLEQDDNDLGYKITRKSSIADKQYVQQISSLKIIELNTNISTNSLMSIVLKWWYNNDYLSDFNNTKFPASCSGMCSNIIYEICKDDNFLKESTIYNIAKEKNNKYINYKC